MNIACVAFVDVRNVITGMNAFSPAVVFQLCLLSDCGVHFHRFLLCSVMSLEA